MKILSLMIMTLIISSCSVKKMDSANSPATLIKLSDSNITFDDAKKTDQNAAEIFDLGQVGSGQTNTKRFYILNNTSSSMKLDMTTLINAISATQRFSIAAQTCGTGSSTLKVGISCYLDISLKYISNPSEIYEPIQIKLTSDPSNQQYGLVLFSGGKKDDVLTVSVPLSSVVSVNKLSDSIVVSPNSSITKRYYYGNIGSQKLLPLNVVAPNGGTISANSCSNVSGVKANGTCYFDVKFDYDASKPNYNTNVSFTSNDPAIDPTGLVINLSVSNPAVVAPSINASFSQSGNINTLSVPASKTRLYVYNNGTSSISPSISIPSPFVVSSTSCSASLKASMSCYYDLSIDQSKVSHMQNVSQSVSLNGTSFNIKAGNQSLPSCESLYSLVNNQCVISNQSKICSGNHGAGNQSSTDGGQTFGSCILSSCDSNYSISQDQLSCDPIACNLSNANINHASIVSGTLISGCVATQCSSGFSVSNGICQNSIIPPVNDSDISVYTGSSSSCNVKNKKVYCAGFNFYGTMGNGIASNQNYSTPQLVNIAEDVQQVATGGGGVCALLTNKTLKCWGSNSWGNLGLGNNSSVATPTSVEGLTNVKSISMTESISCVLFESGNVACAGENSVGTIGDGTNTHRNVFTPVLNINNAIQISVQDYTACALLSDGNVKCWGNNSGTASSSIFGISSSVSPNFPIPTSVVGLSSATRINQPGGSSICAIKNDGTGKCVGAIPQTLALANGTSIIQIIASNDGMMCLLGSDHVLKCKGANINGQLGNGLSSGFSGSYSTPIGLTNNIKAMAHNINARTSFVITSDGSVYGFGLNEHGTLGISAIDGNSTIAVLIPTLTDF